MTHSGAGTATLAVAAANTTTLLANAGGLAVRQVGGDEKVSAGLSGAVAVITADSRVEASVRRATIDGYSLDVSARNARVLGGTSLSGAGGTVGDQGSLTVNFAGSGTGQRLTTTTLATVEGVRGTSLRGSSIDATTSDRVITIAGSFIVNLSSIFSGSSSVVPSTGSGRSVGVGASVAVVSASHTTKAMVANSVLTFAEGNLGVTATESSTAVTVAGGGTYVNTGGSALANYGGSGGSTAAGMVAVVSLDPTVEASITGSTVSMAAAGGDVSVVATTAMLLATVSGAIVVNRDGSSSAGASIGAAVTVVKSTARGTAKVERSTVTVPKGKTRVRSTYGNPSDDAWKAFDPIFKNSGVNVPEAGSGAVWSFAIGAVAADSTVTGAASVNVTNLTVFLDATITGDSTVEANAGSVDVTAINEAKIRTVAGSIATTAFTPGSASAVSAGAAILVTSLGGETKASISSSSVTAGTDANVAESGRVAVTAADRADLLTIAAAGVMSGQNALSTALVFNNLTGRTISAAVTGTESKRSSVSATKAIVVTASEETNLTAVAGQVAIPASTTSVVAGGAAGTRNNIGSKVTAIIEQAAVTSTSGDVTVKATTGGTINAWAVGVSGALSAASADGLMGTVPVSFVGAGSFSLNTITREVKATVSGKASITAKSLTVDAEDSGVIKAVAGALAAQGSSKTVSVAVGVSVANNNIGTPEARGAVQATIDDATASLTGGDAVVTATANPSITSWTIAGTGQVAASDATAVGLSGAGTGNTNTLAIDTLAVITGSATVTTNRHVTVTATDSSKVDSNAGGAGLGIALGQAVAAGVTVGAAKSVVEITNTARAAIETGSVTAGGDVSLTAWSKQWIDALAFGVGISVAGGSSVSVSAAGSGAKSTVALKTKTTAEIVSAAVVAGSGVGGSGSVAVRANDTPTLVTRAGAGSLTTTLSPTASFGLAPGVMLADNTLGNTVTARIGGSDKPAPTVTANGNGSVTVSARSAAEIDTRSMAVAVSAAFAATGLSAAGEFTYAKSVTTVANTVNAEIGAGTISAASVTLRASDAHVITTTVGTVAGAASFLIGGSMGWSNAQATVADTVTAQISGGTVTARAGDVTVEGGSGNKLDTYTLTTSVALSLLSGALTAGWSISKDTSSVTASVTSGATISATGPAGGSTGFLRVRSWGDSAADYGFTKAEANGGSLALTIFTVGRVYAEAESRITREASIAENVDLSRVGGLDVDARAKPDVKAESFAVDVAGLLAIQANESVAKVGGSTKAFTAANVTLPGEVRITASGVTTISADQRGGSGGLVLAYGANVATVTSEMAVSAELGANNKAATDGRVNLLWVTADHRDTSSVYALSGGGSIGGGIASTTATLTDATKTSAMIGATTPGATLDVGTLVVAADRRQSFATQADSYYGGAVVGLGMPNAIFTTTATAETTIAANAEIDATGPVLLRSDNTVARTGTGYAARVAGGGIISVGGASNSGSVNTVTTTSRVVIGNNASITQPLAAANGGGISILPTSDVRIADSVGTWGGGAVAISLLESRTTASVTTGVSVGDVVTLDSRGDLAIGTTTVLDVTNTVEGGSVGAFGVSNFAAATTATTNQAVTFGKNATLAAGRNLSITAGEHVAAVNPSRMNVAATVDAWVGGVITTISVAAPASITNTARVSFGERVNVSSGSDMRIAALPGDPTVVSDGAVTYYDLQSLVDVITGGENVKRATDRPQETNTSTIDLGPVASDGTRGSFTAGSESEVAITIPATASAGTITGVPLTVGGRPVSATFNPEFDPHAYITTEFSQDAALADTLKAAVPTTKGGWQIDPIAVSGGGIRILGDTLSGAASLTAKTGRITVTNDSPYHMVVDALRIANVASAGVTLLSSGGGSASRPGAWTVSAEAATPTITVSQTHPTALSGSGYGPAVFFASPASNPRGQVTISNARGSLGVLGTLAAKSVTINVPNGATVFSVKGAKHAGGPPGTSQAATTGDINTVDTRLMDANKALSYAINALYPNAADDAALNALVYPAVTQKVDESNADRFNRLVYWGGGAPGVTWTTGDVSEATARALMALYRTDSVTTPYAIDGGYLPSLQKLPTSFSADALPSSGGSEAIRAAQIAIYADTINVNGDLVVGDTESPNRSVVVPTTIQQELADYQAAWRDGRQANPLYRIASNQLQKKTSSDALLGVTFDARTGELVVDDADIAAGARLTLVGKIINTSASAGRIRIESGGGGVTIDNRTTFTIATGSISTPGTGLSTTLRIIDALQPEASRQSVYRYVGDEILVYRGAASADLLATATPQRLTGSVTYQPKDNVRWEWSKTATLDRDVYVTFSSEGSDRTSVGDWRFKNSAEPWLYGSGSVSDLTSGRVVDGGSSDPTFTRTLTATQSEISPTLHASSDGNRRAYDWPTKVTLTVTDSIRADHPITISFDTAKAAGVRIDAHGSVLLRDSIESASVTVNSIGGSITALSGSSGITAESVTLVADSGIGRADRPVPVATTMLSAQTVTGDVRLTINGDVSTQGVTLGPVGAHSGGTVSIEAGGDIRAAAADPSRPIDYTIVAGKVSLVSRQGSIGTAAAPLRTHVAPLNATHDTLASPRLRLDAGSVTGVHISHLAGDLLVGTVTATAGDVSLAAAGSLYDAHTWTVNANRQAEIDRILADLGLADTEAAIAKAVAAFQANVKSRYVEYWALKNDGVVFDGRLQLRADAYDKWSARTATILKLPTGARPTTQQVLDQAAKSFATLEDFFSRVVSGSWRTLSAFTAYDAAWTYTPTQVQREQLIADLGLDARTLLVRMGVDLAESLRPWDPAVRVGGTLNVGGTNVTLVSTAGSVGRIVDPVTVLGSQLRAGTLSSAQRFALELAGRRGDATRVNGGIRLGILRPLVLAVGSGKLVADGTQGVAVAQPAGTLAIGRITATEGPVDVAATGSLTNAVGGTGLTTKTPSPAAITATLFSRTGSIGTADSPLVVAGGRVTAAAAAGTVNVQTSEPIVPEAPPRPQPGAAGEPQVPTRQNTDRIDLRPGDVTTFALGGTTPGDGAGKHDQIVVAGQAVLDGTLAVQLAANFVPQVGDRFTIMTYQSVTGRFTDGTGLYGRAGNVYFRVEQTGDATTPGALTLVAEKIFGIDVALSVADVIGVNTAGIEDDIGEFLNRDYFEIAVQVSFTGGFSYGDLDVQGTVTLRHAPRFNGSDRYEMSVIGSARVGTRFDLSGEFLVSVGVHDADTPSVTSVAVLAEDINLDVVVGGATLGATNGRIGILVSDAGVAFEASAGVYANLSSDLSLYADEIFVSYNGTAVDYSGVMFALGPVSYTFGSLAVGAFRVGVTGGELIAGGFLRASGSFAIEGRSQEVTLASGTKVMADVLTIGGVDLGGFAGTGAGTAAAMGATIQDVDFAVALVTEKVAANATARRWLTVEGSGQSASLAGITGVTGSLSNVSVSLNLDAADGSVIDYATGKTSLTVATGGPSGVALTADGSKGQIIRASGTAAFAVEGALSVAGTVGISLEGSNLVAVGTGINATLGATDATTFLKLTNASFGLVATGAETAFEVSGGLSASLAGLANISAQRGFAQYTSAQTAIAAGRTLDTGTASYTFTNAIAKNTVLFAVEDFAANIADFVSLSGDVGFRSDGTGFTAVGSNMSATLLGGDLVTLSATSGALGLSITGGGLALELSARSFQFQIDGLPGAQADTVFFRHTSATRQITSGSTLSVGSVSYTFAEAIAQNTTAFSFTGFQTAVSDVLSISGGFGFAKSGSELIALGSSITGTLRAGGVASVAATNASFGLVVSSLGVAFELQGGFSATIGSLAGMSATRSVVQYTSSGLSIAAGRQVAIGAASYTFATPIAAGTVAFSVTGFQATVSGFTPIAGNLGFAVSGGELVAVGSSMSAGAVGSSFGIRTENASFGLVANAAGTAFELGGGSLVLRVADVANVQSGATFVQFATAGITLAAARTVTAGGLSYSFGRGVSPGASSFAVTGFSATFKDFVSLAGNVGFSLTGGSIVAVAESASATLAAGGYASLSVGGRFGLRAQGDQTVFELTGTNLSASIANLAVAGADRVFVQYATPTASVTAGTVLQVGPASYTFSEAITPGTVAFDVEGLDVNLFGVLTAQGDIGFAYRPTEMLIAAYATNFSAAFTIGADIEASISNATFDIRLGSQILFDIQGDARLKIQDLVDETFRARLRPDYTTLTLDNGSQVEAAVLSFAAALPDLFFGVGGGPDGTAAGRAGLALDGATIGFAVATQLNANRFWVAAKAGADRAGFIGIDQFTAQVADAAVVINTNTVLGNDGRSVDWSATPLTLTPVLFGDVAAAKPITLDMRGATIAARGDATIDLLGIADITGDFSFERSTRNVTLVGGQVVAVDSLTVGIQDANAFLGTTSAANGRKGLAATDVNLAFGLFRERSPATGAARRQWSLLDASVGSAAVVGIPGVTLSATDVEMGYIHLPEDGSAIDTTQPIAYDSTLAFAMNPSRLQPGARSQFTFKGDFDVDVKGLVQFKDSIDIQVELDTLQVYDPVTRARTPEEVATITFAAFDQDLFAGSQSAEKRVGVDLADVDIAAVVAFGPQTGSVWVAVDASAAGVSVVGIPGVSLTTQDVSLRINTPDYRGHVLDFAAQPLEVPTGLAVRAGNQSGSIWADGQSTMLTLDGTLGAEAGVIEITDAIFKAGSTVGGQQVDAFYGRGDYAFRIGQHTTGLTVRGLDAGGGTTQLTDRFAVLSLAATDVDVFVGYPGRDGATVAATPFTPSGVRAGAVGLFAQKIDVGYAVFTDLQYVFDSLKLSAAAASLTGLGDTVTAALQNVTVGRNGGVRLVGSQITPTLASIDFQQSFPGGSGQPAGYRLTTPGGSVTLDAIDAVQAVAAEVGNATLAVDGFLELSGSLAFKIGGQIQQAKADAGVLKVLPGVSVTGLTHDLYTIDIGGRNLRGFAGVTVPAVPGVPGFTQPQRVGVEIEDVTFGLSLMAATSVSGITVPGIAAVLPTYVAAKATVGRAAEVGFDNFLTRTLAGGFGRPIPTIEDVTVEVNTSFLPFAASYAPLQAVASAALPMPALDLTGTAFAAGGPGLEIATGDPARPIVLDFARELIAIDVGYFDVAMFSFFDFAAGDGVPTPTWSAKGVDLVNLGILAASAVMPFAPPSLQVAGNLTLAKRGGERVTLTDGRQIDVTSLGFAMTDVVGFQGAGQYWGRNQTTGRIDRSLPVNTSAIGFAVDDLDLGAVFMLRMPEVLTPTPAVYVGATANLGSARLVGVEHLANARLTNFTLDANLAASLDFTVVDFSRSTHAVANPDGSLTTTPGYAIAGSSVVLAYDAARLDTRGSIDVNLLDAVVLQGDFLFAGSGSSILLYVDGTSRIGPESTPWVSSSVEAFLRIDARGIVSRVVLDTDPIRIGSAVEIVPGNLNLLVNTTGENASFTIPEQLRRPGGPTSITVSATPPGETEAAGYVAISGNGRAKFADALTLAGGFSALLKADVSTLTFQSVLDMPVLDPLTVVGSLQYVTGTNGGLFGSLAVGGANGGSVINVPGVLSLNALMLLEVNTSGIERQVRSVRRAGENDPDEDGYVLRGVPANTLRIAGDGRLTAGGVTFDGSARLSFAPGRILAELVSQVDVGFGSLGVSGEAVILHGDSRPTDFAFAGRSSGRVGAIAGIDGTVFVNTSATAVTLDSGTVVPASTAFDVRLNAQIDIGLFKLDVGGRLFKQGTLWEIRVDQGTMNFFNAATVSGTGFYRSNGAFLFEVRGDLDFSLMGVTVDSTLALTLAQDATGSRSFTGSFDARTTYDFSFASGTGPSFRADVSFGPDRASFSARLSIAGVTIPLAFTWTWPGGTGMTRPLAVLASLNEGVLTLNAGDDPERYGDTNGDWYGSIVNESFRLEAILDGQGVPVPGRIRVLSLGQSSEFSGVTEIVADGGEGNDVFDVGPGITAVLRLSGGPGSDTFLVPGLVSSSVFNGGAGVGFDMLALSGAFAEYLLANDVFSGPTVAAATTPGSTIPIPGIESLRFADRNAAVDSGTDVGGGLNQSPLAVTLTAVIPSLAENAATTPRIKVATIAVTDDAVGVNLLSLSGVDAGAFEIDGTDLYLRAGTVLDYETKPTLRVTVSAIDESLLGSLPVWSDFALTITDANDAPTGITLAAATVAENMPAGTVVGSLSSTDADPADIFSYTLVPGTGATDNAAFRIVNGQVRTFAPLDFEAGATRSIRVRSTDAGGLSFERFFLITVTDGPDAPTAISLTPATVAEDAPVGTTVGTLTSTDTDAGDSFTYTLVPGAGDADNALFTIVGGTLRTAALFDFEARSGYSIRVRTTDSDGLTAERILLIAVTDRNDAPTGIRLTNAVVFENDPIGTVVGGFATTDQDAGDTFTYAFATGTGDADNASFTIVGGDLRTAAVFDYEARDTYSVRIRSTDAGGLVTETSFTINIRNRKEAPSLTIPASFATSEDQPVPLVFPTAPFGITDARASKRVTVVLQVERGTILARSAGGVAVNGSGQARTFTGTLAALNQFFTDPAGRILYRPAADDNGSVDLTVTIAEATPQGVLRRSETSAVAIAAINDAPVVRTPAAFRVTEDVRGAIPWAAVGLPFKDIDSPNLTVTLTVADGEIDAPTADGVTVGGTATARTFAGSTAALNAYFRSAGRVGYTTAVDNTAPRVLTTTVSDGEASATSTSRIQITPVNDAPTIAAATRLTGARARQPFVITHDMLLAASNARDIDNQTVRFRLEWVQSGRIERWNGRRWVAPALGGWPSPTIAAGDRIRWIPPANATGTVPAFSIRAFDGSLSSAIASQVSIDVTP